MSWAVVLAQLVERLLPTPQVRGSIPVIGKLYIEHYFLSTVFKRRKLRKKAPGMTYWKNVNVLFFDVLCLVGSSTLNGIGNSLYLILKLSLVGDVDEQHYRPECSSAVFVKWQKTWYNTYLQKDSKNFHQTRIAHTADCTQEYYLFISMKHPHLPPL